MKCLLRKERGKCFITQTPCNSPVELGDEETCKVYQKEFPQWFEKHLIKTAPYTLQWWIECNTEGQGLDMTEEDVKQMAADNMDIFIDDVVRGLEGLETTISVIPEYEEIEGILKKHQYLFGK